MHGGGIEIHPVARIIDRAGNISWAACIKTSRLRHLARTQPSLYPKWMLK
jgi:hypothetical protein